MTVSIPSREFLPTDVLSIVQGFLQDSPESLVKASQVCQQWRRDFDQAKPIVAAKQRLWESKQSTLTQGIPEELEDLFQRNNLSIGALPRLDLKGKTIVKSLQTVYRMPNIRPSLIGANAIESPIMLATENKNRHALFFRLDTPEALAAYSSDSFIYTIPLVVCVIFNQQYENVEIYEANLNHPHEWRKFGYNYNPEYFLGYNIAVKLLKAMKSNVQQTQGPLPNPHLKKSNCMKAFFERIARCFSTLLHAIKKP